MKAATETAGFAHPERNIAALGIEPGMQVADFGSGSGAYVLAIAERLSHSGHVYAIDVQQELLKRIKNEAARRKYKNVEIIWTDLESPRASKLADRSLDMVLVSNLLFQLEDKETPLREALRILKPLGRLVIIDWSESFGGMGPIKKHVLKQDAAKEAAARAGFAFVKDFDAGLHHYGLIFRLAAGTQRV